MLFPAKVGEYPHCAGLFETQGLACDILIRLLEISRSREYAPFSRLPN